MSWNFDISAAPRGRTEQQSRRVGDKQTTVSVFVPDRVILATKCGKVTLSEWLPKEGRWMMLAAGEPPVAWQIWPEHPDLTPHPNERSNVWGAVSSLTDLDADQLVMGSTLYLAASVYLKAGNEE